MEINCYDECESIMENFSHELCFIMFEFTEKFNKNLFINSEIMHENIMTKITGN